MPYHHPNYKSRYDQQQGQKEHKQISYDFRKECRRNQQNPWKQK